MEERYGVSQSKTIASGQMPQLSKDMIEIRMFKKSVYYKALE